MKKVKDPDASIGVLDPRGSRQMDMQACPLGSLPAGIKKKVIYNLKKCYSIAPLLYQGKKYFLVASKQNGGCVLFDWEGKKEALVWEEPGGTMNMVQLPGTDGWFLATQKFYSPDNAAEAEIVLTIPEDGGIWRRYTLAKLPFIHRFDILFRNGVHYLIACTIKSGQGYEGDWSMPGMVYGGSLPENDLKLREGEIKLTVLTTGLTKNHGYSKVKINGVEKALISAEEGGFLFTPPQHRDGAWEKEQILNLPASDSVLVDLDLDGELELAVIHSFHGDRVSIFKRVGGRYIETYACKERMEFSHAIFGGNLWGYPAVVIGHRMGKRDLAVFWYDQKTGEYQRALLDEDCGAANVFYDPIWNETALIAANRERDEVAMYTLEEQE